MQGDLRWYAVSTRSRHERVAAGELEPRVAEVFVPQAKALSRRKDRRKIYDKVLFPGYLFVRSAMTREDRVAILRAHGVVRILGNEYGPYPCADREIESIRIMIHAEISLSPVPYLHKGQLVMVMEGPFRGVIGRIARSEDGKKRRIVCSIELLGRSVAAQLDREAIEVLPDDPRILPDASN